MITMVKSALRAWVGSFRRSFESGVSGYEDCTSQPARVWEIGGGER